MSQKHRQTVIPEHQVSIVNHIFMSIKTFFFPLLSLHALEWQVCITSSCISLAHQSKCLVSYLIFETNVAHQDSAHLMPAYPLICPHLSV